MRKHLIYLFFVLLSLGSVAQTKLDKSFIEHLVNKANYDEALFLINRSGENEDSTNFYKGWSHYMLKELESSTSSLLKVSAQSNFYMKSQFFAAYNETYLGNFTKTESIFQSLNLYAPTLITIREFQLSGLDLMNKNFKLSENRWGKIDSLNPLIYEPLVNLKNISKELQGHKKKSPLLAAIMSAIVPGSGKYYAGKKGEGISNFIIVFGSGLMTYENYRKLGIQHPKTIAFGAIFAANYVSNIYGSAQRAKIVENDYQNVMHNQILFHLHIPLRNFFE